jgi:hypothetical protein
VLSVRRAYEVIVRDQRFSREVLEDGSAPVAEGFWFDAGFSRSTLDLGGKSALKLHPEGPRYLQAVFIGTRAEQRLLSLQHLPSLEDVGEDHGIEVADMRGFCLMLAHQLKKNGVR